MTEMVVVVEEADARILAVLHENAVHHEEVVDVRILKALHEKEVVDAKSLAVLHEKVLLAKQVAEVVVVEVGLQVAGVAVAEVGEARMIAEILEIAEMDDGDESYFSVEGVMHTIGILIIWRTALPDICLQRGAVPTSSDKPY